MATTTIRYCEFSHTPVAGCHLTGDATLRCHCPGCGRQYVPADLIVPSKDLWQLQAHTPLYTDWAERYRTELDLEGGF